MDKILSFYNSRSASTTFMIVFLGFFAFGFAELHTISFLFILSWWYWVYCIVSDKKKYAYVATVVFLSLPVTVDLNNHFGLFTDSTLQLINILFFPLVIASIAYLSVLVVRAKFYREVSVSWYITMFFLLWVFPVGIWIIQPRMKEIAVEIKATR